MDIFKDTRRGFFKKVTGLTAGLMAVANSRLAAAPARPAGAQYMGDFAAPKLDTVRVAFIGVGARGTGHAEQFAAIEGSEVVAICDLYEDFAQRSLKNCEEAGKGRRHKSIKLYHGDANLWKKMLREESSSA